MQASLLAGTDPATILDYEKKVEAITTNDLEAGGAPLLRHAELRAGGAVPREMRRRPMTRKQKLLAGVSLFLTLVVSTLTVRPDWLMEQLAQANGMGAASPQNCAAPLSLRLKFYDKRPSRETPGPDDLLQPACAVIAMAGEQDQLAGPAGWTGCASR
ncbi:hypothetical protein LP420_06590 [Massilia sp. B-10]|nr:hypothetical protein LP420_06590 [Massilia sp. B-10]